MEQIAWKLLWVFQSSLVVEAALAAGLGCCYWQLEESKAVVVLSSLLAAVSEMTMSADLMYS